MISDYSDSFIMNLLKGQLSFFKIDDRELEQIRNIYPVVKSRVEYNFSHSTNKYYWKNNQVYFSPFQSSQYTIFLYYLSNTLFKENSYKNREICDKIYYLNRMLNSCDLFYEVNLPDIFFLDHPLGSVIGRGKFGNYFSFSQGCTIGNNKGFYPQLGEKVSMLSNSKIIGNSRIGNNVIVAANTYIKDTDIPNNSLVFGVSPNLVVKDNKL